MQELAHYINHVRDTWANICDDDPSIKSQLDARTVEKLQGRCLYYSREDCADVEVATSQREIFSSISSQQVRTGILARLRKIRHLIPSIHTFLEDTKYIEPCAQIMRGILPQSYRGSILEGFMLLHNGQDTLYEQTNEIDFTEQQQTVGMVLWKSYRQLWLFAFRHFPEMTGFPPRKDVGRPKPPKLCIEHTWWHKMASLAEKSGYRNIRTPFPESEDADVRMTQQFLHQVRPSQYYKFDEGVFDTEVLRICSVLSKVQARRIEAERPSVNSNRETGCGPDINNRCGRPYEGSFIADQPSMFLQHIYEQQVGDNSRRFLSTFAVKRCIFYSFFGGPETYPEVREKDDRQDITSGPLLLPGMQASSASRDPWLESDPVSNEDVNSDSNAVSNPAPIEISSPALKLPFEPTIKHPGSSLQQQNIQAEDSSPPSARLIRSPTEGVLVVHPLSPIERGQFQSHFVPWDQASLPESKRKLGVGATESIFMLLDKAQHLKSVPAADVTLNTGSPYKVVIKAPKNKVTQTRDVYEKLSQHSLQAIYTGAIDKVP